MHQSPFWMLAVAQLVKTRTSRLLEALVVSGESTTGNSTASPY
jgi:hypothetical protein